MMNIKTVLMLSVSCLTFMAAKDVYANLNYNLNSQESNLDTKHIYTHAHLGTKHLSSAFFSSPMAFNLRGVSIAPSDSNLSTSNFPQTASVCFITDTSDCGGIGAAGGEDNSGGGGSGLPDWNLDDNKRCKNEGYTATSCSSVQVPLNRCPYNNAIFEKCTCRSDLKTCTKPDYGVGEACGGKYDSCKRDTDKACKEDGVGSNTPCSSAQTPNRTCLYDPTYHDKCMCKNEFSETCTAPYIGVGSACDGKYESCCNTCPDYTYSSIPNGYVSDGECDSCNGKRYKIKPATCTGFPTNCECGYDKSSASCLSGTTTYYRSCLSCCGAEYIYNSSNCPAPSKLSGKECGGKWTNCGGNCSDAGYLETIPSGKTCNSINYLGKICYTNCSTVEWGEAAKYCYGNMTFAEFRQNGEYLGVTVGRTIVSNQVPYNTRPNCISSCQQSNRAGRNWRIPTLGELDIIRCAIKAMNGKTDDVYWNGTYNSNTGGFWLFEENRTGSGGMYSDSSNYCPCVSDL